MKWKNIDIGACYYHITATLVEWLPLLACADIRGIVCQEISRELEECGAALSAYVLMPDHLHMLVYLPDSAMLHRFNRRWRGRSARRIIDLELAHGEPQLLEVMSKHANGNATYAVWKEQVRALVIWNEKKVYSTIDYIHNNPVRRGLARDPSEWEHSSFAFYEKGQAGELHVTPLLP